MSISKFQLYFLAWGVFISAGILGYPYLRITVMQFSIPLAMLGGWFYSYKGALVTTILTTPYHYLLLSYYSDDAAVLVEAFNPFGIGSLVLFSLSAALLQSLRQRYQKLNDELEYIVAERTNNLRQLADHLINMKYIDRSIITSGMLNDPLSMLESMQEASSYLCTALAKTEHPERINARIVHVYIQQCIEKLGEFMHESEIVSDPGETLREKAQKLSDKMMYLSRGRLHIDLKGKWHPLDTEVTHQLHNIISEAVANAIRHAQATEISIGFKCEHGLLIITVENNGAPFPSQPLDGMGLPLMRHRAMSIGGTLTIEGGTSQRTRVICTIPHPATSDKKAFPRDGQRLNTTA